MKMNCCKRVSMLIKCFLILTSFEINQISTQFAESIHMVNITRSDNFNSGDRINLLVVNSSMCENVKVMGSELSAQCTKFSQPTSDPDQNCYLECVCLNETGSFLLNEKKCSDERKLRQGCSLVFGSWSWSTRWLWNSDSDRLPILYLEDGFGIEAGFNVSTVKYSECTLTSLSILDPTGVWTIFIAPANESFVNFFKLRGYWHVSWIIEDLRESKKEEIEGKFVKLDLICENSNEANGIVEVTQLSSCLVFKVTGNVSHEYNFSPTSTSTLPSTTGILVTDILISIQSSNEQMQSSSIILDPTSSIVIQHITPTSSHDMDHIVISIQSPNEQMQSSTNILDPTSSIVIQHITPTSSHDMESSFVTQSSSVIKSTAVIQSSSAINSTPVPINSPIIKGISATKSNLVTKESSALQAQSTQAIISDFNTTEKPNGTDAQIGLILGIVVAGAAAVVISVAVIALTVTSLYNSHVKRTQIIQNDANNIHMESLDDKIFPAHI